MTDKLDVTKIKNFCVSKQTTNRIKRQPMEWEKIFVNHTSEKELISGIYKELLNMYTNKTNNLIKKWAKGHGWCGSVY